MRRSRLATLLLALAPASAQAAGIGRPNVGGARAIGWGGAFTAIADDPTALHHNPAGMATQYDDSVLVGGEFVIAPRSYTPVAADGTSGPAEEPANTPNVLPTLGYVTRLEQDGMPSHLALGIGVWNTFGGHLTYDKSADGVSNIDEVRTAVVEVVPGVAYEVNSFLQLGAAFRLGIGLFDIVAESLPADADISGVGFGVGFTLGAMIAPSEQVRIGLTYRSPLTVAISGDGGLDERGTGDFVDATFDHDQEWPAQGSLGVRYALGPALSLAAQADWTDWSRVNEQVVRFSNGFNQVIDADFKDSLGLHLAAQYVLSESLSLRGGYTFESSAVPDRTMDRQYLDTNKHGLGLGSSIRLSESWSLELALEAVFFPKITIADNREQYAEAGWATRANVAPGDHEGQIFSLDVAGLFRY